MTHTFGYGVCVFIAEIEAFDDLSLYLFSDGLSFRRRIVNCETSRDVLWSVVCGPWSVVCGGFELTGNIQYLFCLLILFYFVRTRLC